jgi:hypothetical protein
MPVPSEYLRAFVLDNRRHARQTSKAVQQVEARAVKTATRKRARKPPREFDRAHSAKGNQGVKRAKVSVGS